MASSPTPASRLLCVVLLVAVLATAGCGGGGGSAEPAATPSTRSSDVDGAVSIGDGRKVYATCRGHGSPTVLLESGDESDTTQWAYVFPGLAEKTRTCAYSRLGTGSSDAATGCRHLADLRGDLEALLTELDEPGPYLLVGTSGGGFLMAGFAYAHPELTQGIVLVETPHAIVPAEITPDLAKLLRCRAPANVEHRDYVDVENEAWRKRHRIGDIPMTVITNDYRGHGENHEQQTNVQGQRGWLVLSPRARQVIVTSGHDVANREPDLVLSEILKVLDAARAG